MKKTFGTFLCEKRKELGYTQLDIANQMQVTDKAVSKWERDLSYPDINSLPKLAEILHVSVEELMQVESKKEKEENIHDIFCTVLKAIPLAMGVATIVLSMMNKIDIHTAIQFLSIGMVSLSLFLLQNKRSYD